jgi:phage gpG-like protein
VLNATNALYSIPSVVTNNAGNYAVVVTNSAGSATSSNAALTVVLSPQSRTNYAGSVATFTATAFSPEWLNYQWQKNGTNLVEGGRLSGTTNSTLTIASVSDADAANYSAVVSDACGSVTTSNAALTVIDPPSITAQPLGQRVMLGSSVSFSVSVSGTAPFSYQWRFNGNGILNATNNAYAIQAVVATNTGNYSVVVNNPAGSVTSSNALLTVIIPPTLALQLWAGYPLLDLNGMLSSNFVVQYSTNLAGSNWMNLLSLSNLPASPYLFLDPAGDGEPARFYRAFMR